MLFNNTKLGLQRAERRSMSATDEDESSKGSSKVPRRSQVPERAECFLCEEEKGDLREAMTMKLNKRLNECAKLNTENVVAQEMKYHHTCLVVLYNRERAHLQTEELEIQTAYPIAFSGLVTYISEKLCI